jgi:hypothetical protein
LFPTPLNDLRLPPPPRSSRSHSSTSLHRLSFIQRPRHPLQNLSSHPMQSRLSPGDGLIVCALDNRRRAVFESTEFSYPLKLIVPRRTYLPGVQCIYVLGYGGGLVAGDRVRLKVEARRGTTLVLLTQGAFFPCPFPPDKRTEDALSLGRFNKGLQNSPGSFPHQPFLSHPLFLDPTTLPSLRRPLRYPNPPPFPRNLFLPRPVRTTTSDPPRGRNEQPDFVGLVHQWTDGNGREERRGSEREGGMGV